MSRLYIVLSTDMSAQVSRRANKALNLAVNYGSKADSKEALRISVDYPKGATVPNIVIVDRVGATILKPKVE